MLKSLPGFSGSSPTPGSIRAPPRTRPTTKRDSTKPRKGTATGKKNFHGPFLPPHPRSRRRFDQSLSAFYCLYLQIRKTLNQLSNTRSLRDCDKSSFLHPYTLVTTIPENDQLRIELHEKEQIIQELLQEIAELRGLPSDQPATNQPENAEEPPLDQLLHNLRVSSRELIEKKRLRKKLRKILKKSILFHSTWYSDQYPDVAESGMEPAEHYLLYGAAEGRNPSTEFNTLFYLKSNEDVAESGENPLIHYIRYGKDEGRCISAKDGV